MKPNPSLVFVFGVILGASGCGPVCRSSVDCPIAQECSANGTCVLARPTSEPDDGAEGEGEQGQEGEGEGPPLPVGCSNLSESLNPDRVYLFGSWQEGSCGTQGLAPIEQPNDVAWGVDCYVRREHALVRPTDGRFLYMRDATDGVFEFVPDDLLTFSNDTSVELCAFRSDAPDPLANDPRLPTQGCRDTDTPRFASLFIAPDDGELIYQCSNDSSDAFYDQAGSVVFTPIDNAEILALGRARRLLLRNFDALEIEANGVRTPVTGDPVDLFRTTTARASSRGFYLVTEQDSVLTLFEISTGGEITNVGDYPALAAPDRYGISTYTAKLDDTGALYALGSDFDTTFNDVAFKFVVGEPFGQVIYSEDTDPLLKQHGSFLVSTY